MGLLEKLMSLLTTGKNSIPAKRILRRPIKYRSISGKIFYNKENAVEDNKRYMRAPNTYRLKEKEESVDSITDPRPYKIPYIKNKGVTLTNAGRATGAHLSTNMLDSIAKYSTITGLPFRDAVGLATKESTLGNPTTGAYAAKILKDNSIITQHINDGRDWSPLLLITYGRYGIGNNPYAGLRHSIKERVSSGKINVNDADRYVGWELPAADKYFESEKKYITGPPLQAGFNFYKDYPNRYNPGMPGYQKYVQKSGDEVLGSPEVQQWMSNTTYLNSEVKNRYKR